MYTVSLNNFISKVAKLKYFNLYIGHNNIVHLTMKKKRTLLSVIIIPEGVCGERRAGASTVCLDGIHLTNF